MASNSAFGLFVVIFISLFSAVNGGHFLWESHLASTVNETYLPGHALDKRQFRIKVSEGVSEVWPDKTIKYCFNNAETRNLLSSALGDAMALWWAQGLPYDFQLKEVDPLECKGNRANVLLVRYSADHLLTTNGKRPPNPAAGIPDGPSMVLTDRLDVGMGDAMANYAHELGHAWGLLHEHQNFGFWEPPYITSIRLDDESPFVFNCQNLKDYAEKAAIYSSQPEILLDLCIHRSRAEANKFSATEFLPITPGEGQSTINLPTNNDVDWLSIMLYPSGAGGRDDGQGGRAPVLQRRIPGGAIDIPPNLIPSPADVEAIKSLYATHEKYSNPQLIVDPHSPSHSKFKRFIKKCMLGKGSSSGSG